MAIIQLLGELDNINKILSEFNVDSELGLTNRAHSRASVVIANCYTNSEKTLPATKSDDPLIYDHAEALAAEYVKLWLADNDTDKRGARAEIENIVTAVKAHLGVTEGEDTVAPDPTVISGPRLDDIEVNDS